MTILNGVATPFPQRARVDSRLRWLTSLAGFRVEVFALDVIMVALACLAAPTVLGFQNPVAFPTPLLVSMMLAAGWLASVALMGGYRIETSTTASTFTAAIKGSLLLLAIVAVAAYLGFAAPYNQRVLISLVIGLPLLLISRAVMLAVLRKLRAAGAAQTRLLVVSNLSTGVTPYGVAADPRFRMVDAVACDGKDVAASVSVIADRVSASAAQAVFVEDPASLGVDGIRHLAWELEPTGTELLVGSSVTRFARGRSHLATIGDEAAIRIDHSHQSRTLQAIKRGFDIVVATALLVIAAPVIALTALAIRIESPGPVFFVQPRVGRNGELFRFFKLRSMRVNAHLERSDILGPTDEGILDRYRNDDRITRVGSFIRRWSIDELPQLANVLLGHMSLVGPRPVLVEELHDLPADGDRVHLAKPGLTGLWQISGRKEIRWEDRIDLDLEYVDAWSLGMDARILSRTAGAVVKGSGAY